MDDILFRNDLRDDEKAKRYFQLQNRFLAFKEQLNTRTRREEIISSKKKKTCAFLESRSAKAS